MTSMLQSELSGGKAMEFLLGFGIGMSFGSCVGVMVAAMLRMSKEGDRQLDLTTVDESATGEVGEPPDGVRQQTLCL
jgi:hypothetical protein